MSQMTREQLDWIEESEHRVVRKALKRQALGAAIGFLVLFGGAFLAGKAYLDTLHEGLVGSCDRVNVLRAQSNLSDTVSFNILSNSGRREVKLARIEPTARKTHEASAMGLFAQARTLTVTKMTDCSKAVGDPKHFHTPVAGPIGNPATGKLSPGVAQVIRDSHETLLRERTR